MRTWRTGGAGVVFFFLLAAQSALADGAPGGGMPGIPPTAVNQYQRLPNVGAPNSTGKSSGSGAGASNPRTVAQLPGAVRPKVKVRCTWSRKHHRGTRTCRYYLAHILFKKCVKKPHDRQRCATVRAAAAAQAGRRAHVAGTSLNEGFLNAPLSAVVRIYWTVTRPNGSTYSSECSGSVLTKGLILTAGHCVYSNVPDGEQGDGTGFAGYYDPTTYVIVPGNTVQNGVAAAPYGEWTVKSMWTTADYAYNGVGGDWGIIEVNPNSEGWPGDVVGTVAAEWDQTLIDDLYSVGYSASGAFLQSQYGGGNKQFYCENTWSPSDSQTDASYEGYYAMLLQPCEADGGASGGPVFTYTPNGWMVVGVNNRGAPRIPYGDTTSVGQYMMSFWLDDRFGQFWNYVVNQVNAGY